MQIFINSIFLFLIFIMMSFNLTVIRIVELFFFFFVLLITEFTLELNQMKHAQSVIPISIGDLLENDGVLNEVSP